MEIDCKIVGNQNLIGSWISCCCGKAIDSIDQLIVGMIVGAITVGVIDDLVIVGAVVDVVIAETAITLLIIELASSVHSDTHAILARALIENPME